MSLKHLLGNDSIKAMVAVALESAFADNRRFDSSLLVGPPGLGKSALASVIAQEMGVGETFTEVIGQSITDVGDLNALLLAVAEKSVLHIDEAHELDKRLQTALYLALDKKCIFANTGKGGKPCPIRIADFTLLLSTTDEYCLLQPLRDRMKLVLRFQYLTVEELTQITKQRSQALRWQVAEEVFPVIAQRAKGTPRLALRLLQSSRRVARAEGETSITAQHLERACALEQIDCLGLGPLDQQYLRQLADGPVRLNVIASVLGLPPRTIAHVFEPFLMRAGLIAKDDQSRRMLTDKGIQHLRATGGGKP
jgi:Holliday junction DNA helicase RuvB